MFVANALSDTVPVINTATIALVATYQCDVTFGAAMHSAPKIDKQQINPENAALFPAAITDNSSGDIAQVVRAQHS